MTRVVLSIIGLITGKLLIVVLGRRATDDYDWMTEFPLHMTVAIDRRRHAVGVPVLSDDSGPCPVPGEPATAPPVRRRPLVVSEPLGGLRGAWWEVPASTRVVVRHGQEELRPFVPTVLEPVG